jgi:hypothetical protein
VSSIINSLLLYSVSLLCNMGDGSNKFLIEVIGSSFSSDSLNLKEFMKNK